MMTGLKYLNQKEASKIDELLMGEKLNYSIYQLMELAGLGCACAIEEELKSAYPEKTNILVCCGPGNNGGDGLVCARHLKLFGYNVTICYPKRTDKEIYKRLLNQCVEMDIEVIKNYEGISAEDIRKNYALVVDALFGFGFRGPLRAPFDSIIKELTDSKVKLCSIDVPSGWNIDSEEGSVGNESLIQPTMLISLTAPKLCSKNFKNCHYLAGRFLPPKLEKDFNLNLPCTPPGKLFMKI